MKKFISLALIASTPLSLLAVSTEIALKTNGQVQNAEALPPYKAKDFSYLLGMPGFTNDALNMHFKLYQGYVTNTNLLISILNQLSAEGKQRSPQFQELKRRFGWEFDGMRLHELYFGNLGGTGTKLNTSDPLYKAIVRDYGTYDAWKKDFVETGMLRGIGWVVLYQSPIDGRLINTWVGEHDMGNLAGAAPLLIMDVWEHAYMPDYGLDRMGYIQAFFDNLNWNTVAKRYKE